MLKIYLLEEQLNTLNIREKELLKLRFGIKNKQEHTLKECSKIFDVTPARIRQIERKALRKLSHPSRSN